MRVDRPGRQGSLVPRVRQRERGRWDRPSIRGGSDDRVESRTDCRWRRPRPIGAALTFAADEAVRVGSGVHLVHVVHLLTQGPETGLTAETDPERAGRLALNAAVEQVRDLAPAGVPVTSELLIGAVVPTLVDAAADARMVVIEHRDLSRMKRLVTRSVTSGLAAHARVPVVAVPSGWSPPAPPEAPRTVTVGVDVPDRCEHVLRTAAAEAGARGATLHVLHTWTFPSPYEDLAMSRDEDEDWAKRAAAEIQSVFDTLGAETSQVPVEIDARHAYPADALIESSRTSDLLVIGRHDPAIPIGSHLGPVARGVLREAACPVLLADPVPTDR
ncbi:MAG: universal stress protein [Nocardioides sp.]